MGGKDREHDDDKDAALPTKKKFRQLWSEVVSSSDEHWLLDLRGCANLIGLCLYPVGWAWSEYPPTKYSKIYPWEKKALKVRHFNTALSEPQVAEGSAALQNGVTARRIRIEQLLMGMLKRKEIKVTIYDRHMRGFEIGKKMRLDATLKLNIKASVIGFNELIGVDAWDCSIDTKSLLSALESRKGWDTKAVLYDWLKIERHARDLYEIRGVPKTKGSYVDLVNLWYAHLFEHDPEEPTLTTLQGLISKLHAEYSH